MDKNDWSILRHLLQSGRATWAELANIVGLTPPAVAERVRKLEDSGVISGYAALGNPLLLGCSVAAFISVTLEHPRYRNDFLHLTQTQSLVMECHHVAGEADYILKVRCRTTAELETFLSETLKSLPGISSTRTTVILSSSKENPRLPLGDDA